jgi:CHAD domain-containing protein
MAARLEGAIAAEPAELVVGPVAAHVHRRLGTRTAETRARLTEALDDPRYAALLDVLDELVDTEPSGAATGKRLRRLTRTAVRRADERLDRAAGDSDRDAHLHDARKAYKRARYATEAIAPLSGKPARRLSKRLTAVQDLLGAHQDAIVTGELLREYGMRAHSEGENAFTYGLLHARQQDADVRRLERLRDARRRVGQAKVRRWLEN